MLLILIFVILTIGFFTLLERKILRLTQNRIGPNKTSIIGVIQPILDGVKLFKKLNLFNVKLNIIIFNSSCVLIFIVSFLLWIAIPFLFWCNKSLILLWILLIYSTLRFFILILGWSSLRKYGYLGSIRRISQIIRLEVVITVIIFIPFIILSKIFLEKINNVIFLILIRLIFFILIVAESQRAPIDLAEGERELVSGYNTEFRRIIFTLIFLSEYRRLIFNSGILSFIWFNFNLIIWIIFLLLLLIIRSCYPRLRYDNLINFFWIHLVPLRGILLYFIWGYKII